MRDNARWQLTDFQRFLVAVMIAAAGFLSAMAWGMSSLIMLLIAVAIVIIAGLGVFLLGLYYNSRPSGSGTATVVEAPPPPVGQIVARADLRVRLNLKGARGGVVKLRDPAVPTSKWPRPGNVLPVEVDAHTRHLRVRWDLADLSQARAPEQPEAVDEDIQYMPTPPVANPPIPASPTPRTNATQPSPSKIYLDDDMALGPGPELTDGRDPSDLGVDLSDLDLDLSDLDLSDLDLSDLDLIDLGLAEPDLAVAEPDDDPVTIPAETIQPTSPAPPPAVASPEPDADLGDARAQAAGYELPMRPIPQPRPAEPETGTAPKPTALPARAMGIMLIVADVTRSLAFYRDLLGFTVVDSTTGSVVLGFGTGRVLLRQVADMSPVDRRVVHLHIEVSDVESSYRELKAKGVSFVHRPRVMSRGDKLELWAATFRDPDGHAIALTQWRDREDAPH